MPDTPPAPRNEQSAPTSISKTTTTTAFLDHTSYPHLIDHILSHLTYVDLLPLRSTSHLFNAKATTLLSHHLRVTRHTQSVHIGTALTGYTFKKGHPVGAVLSLSPDDDSPPILRGLSPGATRILTITGRVPAAALSPLTHASFANTVQYLRYIPATDPATKLDIFPRLHGLTFATAPTAIVFRHLVPVGDMRARSLVSPGSPTQPDAVARVVMTIGFSREDLRLWPGQILPCSASRGVTEVVFRFAEIPNEDDGGGGDGTVGDSGLEEEDLETILRQGIFIAPPGLLSITLQRMAHLLHRISFTFVGLPALGAAALGFAARTDKEEVVEALREVLVAERWRLESEWDSEDEARSGGSRGKGPIAPEDVVGSEEAVRAVVGRMVRFVSEEEYVAKWPEEAELSGWYE